MNASQNNIFVQKLQEISKESYSLRSKVAQELLEHGSEDISCLFHDLFAYGCISGIICSLIYYADTHTFYDEYYNEIEDLRYNYENSMGQSITIKGDLKSFMAQFAFEETAYQLANELGITI